MHVSDGKFNISELFVFFSIVNGICDSSVLGISLFTMYMQEIYLHASYS